MASNHTRNNNNDTQTSDIDEKFASIFQAFFISDLNGFPPGRATFARSQM